MIRQTAVIPAIVERHFTDAAFLSQLRRRACSAPDWAIADLATLDERLEGHLEGLRIAGEYGWKVAEDALQAGPHELFVAGVLAVESRERSRMARVLRESIKSPEAFDAIVWSFERVAPMFLQGTIKDLLDSSAPIGRRISIAACACHGVNPGPVLARLVNDTDPAVRAEAIRACGELGLTEHLDLLDGRTSEDGELLWWTAWASVLLGNRGTVLEVLTRAGLANGPHRLRAFRLLLQTMSPGAAHTSLRELAKDPARLRWLIQGSGIAGDPVYAAWLIGHMANEKTARLAGEAFSLMTGVDLGESRLERERPKDFESGPNDDPDDPNVDMDPEDGLPWPDLKKVETWWAANASRFQTGTRYFMGAPVTRQHCIEVLKSGYQRQRILAAHYLCLLDPGTALFNTSAPAWRQQRLLAKMT